MFSIATVLVIFRFVSVIFRPIENLLMRKIAAGNMRKAMATWIQRMMESLSSFGLRLANVVWPKSVAFQVEFLES